MRTVGAVGAAGAAGHSTTGALPVGGPVAYRGVHAVRDSRP
ncbi:hypothetical protein GZL_02109 [Streptomyces sp. 769]|nr:hypothetical protein GZL_02109 [Streptomyces sp. 769]